MYETLKSMQWSLNSILTFEVTPLDQDNSISVSNQHGCECDIASFIPWPQPSGAQITPHKKQKASERQDWLLKIMYWFHEVFSESLESYLLARNFDKLTTVSQQNRNKQDGEAVGSTGLETGKTANGKSWLHDSKRWGKKVIQDDGSKLQ